MALKNYTTSIKLEKTISEIEERLAKFKASHIFKMYNDEGIPQALAFKMLVQEKEISFKLPMEENKIVQVFNNQVKRGLLQKRYYDDIDQARRTGWRIIKDWLDSQLALLEINVAKPEEIFLPYMYNEKLNKTMFHMLEEKQFTLNQLEDKTGVNENE